MIDLPQFQFSTIIGLYLSDGSSTLSLVRSLSSTTTELRYKKVKVSKRNARFDFKKSYEKFDYFFMVFSIFSHYCSRVPSIRVSTRKGIANYSLEFNTRALPCFTVIHKLFFDKSDSNYSSRIGKKNNSSKYFPFVRSCGFSSLDTR